MKYWLPTMRAKVREMACHASRISGIEAVEEPGRILYGS